MEYTKQNGVHKNSLESHSDSESSSSIRKKSFKKLKDKFKKGNKDGRGYEIKHIYTLTTEYVVYRTDVHVSFYINDDHQEPKERKYFKNFQKIRLSLTTNVDSILPDNINKIEKINKIVAQAITLGLEGDSAIAKAMLKEAGDRLKNLRKIEGRIKYYGGSLLVCLSVLGLFLVLFIFNESFNSISIISSFSNYLEIILYGALGGIFSVAFGINQLAIDLDETDEYLYIAGGSRIFIALISSLIVYFAVKSNIIFGSVVPKSTSGLDSIDTVLKFILMASGFSESLIPNLIKKISSQELENHENNTKK